MRVGDSNFFNLFARLETASNRDRDCDEWRIGDVHWHRLRHIHWGPNVSFQLTTHALRHGTTVRAKWQLLVGVEVWWAAKRDKPFRNLRWAHVTSGRSTEILRWFAEREPER